MSKKAKTKKKDKAAKHQPPNEIVKARYDFTVQEKADLGQGLAREVTNMQATEAELKSVQSTYKARIAEHESKIGDLQNKLTLGFEMRDTEARIELDVPNGKKKYFRLDNGKHLFDQPMQKSDYELELFEREKIEKAKKAAEVTTAEAAQAEASGAVPKHDTANPPPAPEKPAKTGRKRTKAQVADELASRSEGDK